MAGGLGAVHWAPGAPWKNRGDCFLVTLSHFLIIRVGFYPVDWHYTSEDVWKGDANVECRRHLLKS
jgi:hypothetical protein